MQGWGQCWHSCALGSPYGGSRDQRNWADSRSHVSQWTPHLWHGREEVGGGEGDGQEVGGALLSFSL